MPQAQMRKDNNMGSGNGYEKYTIAEIREVLTTEYDIEDEKILSQTKRPLAQLLVKLQQEREAEESKVEEEVENLGYQVEDIEDDNDYTIDTHTLNDDPAQEAPHFYSSLWSTYVMSLFDKSELYNGHPTCDSCRRLVNQLLGPIVESE